MSDLVSPTPDKAPTPDEAPTLSEAPRHGALARSCHRIAKLPPRLLFWGAAVAVVFVFNAPSLPLRAINDGNLARTGFRTKDEMFYFACSREAVERGLGGVIYAHPFAFEPESPRIYSQLYFVVNGWIWKWTGLSFPAIDRIQRLLFGVFFLGMAAECFYARFGRWRLFWPAIGLLFCGGGGAWFFATLYTAGMWLGPLSGGVDYSAMSLREWTWIWRDQFAYFEGIHGTWGVNFFRRLFMGPQVFYHTLFYAGWLCLLRQRWGWALMFSFLLWWAHPFTAVDFALPLLAIAAIAMFNDRATPLRTRVWRLAGAAGVMAAGMAYYQIFLLRFPVHVQTQAQMIGVYHAIAESQLFPAFGALIFIPLLMMWYPPDWREHSAVATACLCVCVLALTFHDALVGWLGIRVQPLHFEQGYLYFSLMFLACEMFSRRLYPPGSQTAEAPQEKRAKPRRLKWILAVAALTLLPDNVYHYFSRTVPGGYEPGILIQAREKDLCQSLNGLPERLRLLPLQTTGFSDDWMAYATIVTPHAFPVGHPINTPHYEERLMRLREFARTGDLTLWRENAPQALIVAKNDKPVFESVIRPRGRYSLMAQTPDFEIYRIENFFQ
ncbi:MAG: hypothetical protein NTX50_05695 [Candidatus Sumerlaeota bacterium]|nr:hypothetical protein [Candidatus Sumerlaeota bacterium]